MNQLRLFVSFFVFILATNAMAQTDEENHAEAMRLHQMGELQYQGNEFEEAADFFVRAYDTEPNAYSAFSAALAYENIGRLQEALTYFEYTAALDSDPETATATARGIQRIQAIINNIEANTVQTGTLFIETDPANGEVFIDNTSFGHSPIEIEMDPGEHLLTIELENYESYESTLEVDAGETIRMLLPLSPISVEVEESEDIVLSVTLLNDPEISLVPAYVLFTSAVLFGISGYIFSSSADELLTELESGSGESYRGEGPDGTIQTGKTYATIGQVNYGIAGTSVVGGIIYLILRRTEFPMLSGVSLTPNLNGAQLSIQF